MIKVQDQESQWIWKLLLWERRLSLSKGFLWLEAPAEAFVKQAILARIKDLRVLAGLEDGK